MVPADDGPLMPAPLLFPLEGRPATPLGPGAFAPVVTLQVDPFMEADNPLPSSALTNRRFCSSESLVGSSGSFRQLVRMAITSRPDWDRCGHAQLPGRVPGDGPW